MRNKYIAFLAQEPRFILKIFASVAFVFLSVLFLKLIKIQDLQLSVLLDKKQFVAKIPEFKSKIYQLESKIKNRADNTNGESQPRPLKDKSLVLSGILILNKEPAALINGEVYLPGDILRNSYVIREIKSDSVTLTEMNTGDSVVLKLD